MPAILFLEEEAECPQTSNEILDWNISGKRTKISSISQSQNLMIIIAQLSNATHMESEITSLEDISKYSTAIFVCSFWTSSLLTRSLRIVRARYQNQLSMTRTHTARYSCLSFTFRNTFIKSFYLKLRKLVTNMSLTSFSTAILLCHVDVCM